MPNFSILTNANVFAGLRNLAAAERRVDEASQRVATGQRVRGAVDDASSFAIAQGVRATIRAVDSVIQGLNNAKGIAKVALAAATAVSDLMADIRQKITQAANPGNTTAQSRLLQDDFAQQLAQMRRFLEEAEFNGVNIVIEIAVPFNTAVGTVRDVDVLSSPEGDTLRLHGQRLDLLYALLAQENVATPAAASQALTVWTDNVSIVNTALGQLGADTRALESQVETLFTLRDATEEGLGNIVDADLARESARLTAAEVQQELSVSTLQIAQRQPQSILALFPA